MEKAATYLINHRIRPSVQRMAIMKYLLEHKTHPSADEIYLALSPSMVSLSKTTVYTTLKLLTDHGAAQMITIDEHNACFDADTSTHAHFLCKSCGNIYDLFSQKDSKEVLPFDLEGHDVTEMHYYYKGFCKNCISRKDE
ncbi:transcriptional repressor [uncultured Bacteroides sp.]|uniref:Fur family transcriptional regulator n=1 Tax=uncultured Bacteroides sp. TaxID=162156 RepID=UPI002AAAE47E|nr:transcriptional repressor [uncultured Bacteroides sp.]